MATYDELKDAMENASLQTRMRIAVLVAADIIRVESSAVTNHAARLVWAKAAFQDPIGTAESMLRAVVIQNRAFTAAQITGATDATLQTAVNAAVDIFAQG